MSDENNTSLESQSAVEQVHQEYKLNIRFSVVLVATVVISLILMMIGILRLSETILMVLFIMMILTLYKYMDSSGLNDRFYQILSLKDDETINASEETEEKSDEPESESESDDEESETEDLTDAELCDLKCKNVSDKCENGKMVWENYIDKYSLLRDSNRREIKIKNDVIKRIELKYTILKHKTTDVVETPPKYELRLLHETPNKKTSTIIVDSGNPTSNENVTMNENINSTILNEENYALDETMTYMITSDTLTHDNISSLVIIGELDCASLSIKNMNNETLYTHSFIETNTSTNTSTKTNIHIFHFGQTITDSELFTRGIIDERTNMTRKEYQIPIFAKSKEHLAYLDYGKNPHRKMDCTNETFTTISNSYQQLLRTPLTHDLI